MPGDRLRAAIASTRLDWQRRAAISFVAALLLAGFWWSVAESGLVSTVENVLLNVLAAAIVAVAALALFIGLTRFDVFRRLNAYQSATLKPLGRLTGKRPNQARAIVARLQDDRQAGSVFLDAPTVDAGESFIADLLHQLVAAEIVALVIPPELVSGDFRTAVSREFEGLLRRAGISNVSFERTLKRLAARRKIAVVIKRLDSAPQIGGHEQTRSLLRRRADELASSGYPFIAVINPASLSEDGPYERVSITPVEYVDIDFEPDATGGADEPMVRKAAMALQRSGLQRDIIFSDPSRAQIKGATERLIENGVVHFGCALLTTALPGAGIGAPSDCEVRILRLLIARLLISGGEVADLLDLYADVRNDGLFDVVLAVERLEERKVLRRWHIDGKTMIGFIDPGIGEIAIGWWLAKQREQYVLSAKRTDLCVAAEIYQRTVDADADPAERLARWSAALNRMAGHKSARARVLTICNLAFGAILADGVLEVGHDVGWLSPAWDASDLQHRCEFVNQIASNQISSTAPFLWSRVVDEEYAKSPHMLRRSICRVLGYNGLESWNALGSAWRQLVPQGDVLGESMTASGRPLDERGQVNFLGSLCWVLPSVVVTAPGEPCAVSLLEKLTALAVPPDDVLESHGASPPDPGLEISLAEGFKDACFLCFAEGTPVPDRVMDPLRTLLLGGRSWASRLIALQGRFVACALKPKLAKCILHECEDRENDPSEHPLVKRYARLLTGPLNQFTQPDTQVKVSEYVWADDIEALSEAGGELGHDAALILASFAMLLNFSGAREKLGIGTDDEQNGRWARQLGLTKSELPPCLSTAAGARRSTKSACQRDGRCEFKLCGPDIRNDDPETVRRPFSRAFAYRCLAASASDGSVDDAKADRAIKTHLRRLTGMKR
ncbi:hypothetical protein [Mycobacterium sp. E2733]|uniref:hypothetical protein n=1 Tax=Mycobacterium sp. E2733 TaxID=1834138 RepID=UPI0008004304|nr:hypothetical protein [Mycobacterium sp. E2733]OBI00009.1 hypothetical protein A5678_01155 [Mycobacterium sp. E2733]